MADAGQGAKTRKEELLCLLSGFRRFAPLRERCSSFVHLFTAKPWGGMRLALSLNWGTREASRSTVPDKRHPDRSDLGTPAESIGPISDSIAIGPSDSSGRRLLCAVLANSLQGGVPRGSAAVVGAHGHAPLRPGPWGATRGSIVSNYMGRHTRNRSSTPPCGRFQPAAWSI